MQNKDLIKISVQNSYEDTQNVEIINPNCQDVVKETISALKLLGFSPINIYIALEEQAEFLKQEILTK